LTYGNYRGCITHKYDDISESNIIATLLALHLQVIYIKYFNMTIFEDQNSHSILTQNNIE